MMFGYGSLMFPDGLNARGMKKLYTWTDLIRFTLPGFCRSLNVLYHQRYYGLTKYPGSDTIGILFPIDTFEDYIILMKSEYAYPIMQLNEALYRVENITEHVPAEKRQNKQVVTLITKTPSTTGPLALAYIEYVWQGIQKLDESFCKKFLTTGGISYGNVRRNID